MTTESSADDRTALVTGASSGIGAELTKQIASDEYDVVLTARREDRLARIAGEVEDRFGVTTTVIPKDLADPGSPRELFDEVQNEGIHVNTLVNNAGVGVYGPFVETPIEEELAMMQVNMVALTHLTKLFVEPMVERGDGAILNTSGLAAYFPLPKLAVHAATKAYVLSFSEALAHELADEGVQVTTLCPGAVDSDFFQKADMEDTKLAQGSKIDPATAAKAAWDGVKSGKRIVKPGRQAKLFSQVPRLLPETTVTSIGAKTADLASE